MKRGREWKWLLVALPLVFILALLGVMVLIQTDKHYACMRSFWVKILGTENHFNGDLWFSAEVTLIGAFISAIPGLMCGILAYIQTERLHELEDRYHRPGIELGKAQIGAVKLKITESKMEDIRVSFPEPAYTYRYGIEEAYRCKYPLYINFEVEFSVKNEITIKEVYIKQIDFLFSDNCWVIDMPPEKEQLEELRHLTWDFSRKIGKDGIMYTLECSLCPPEGPCDENVSDAFWKAIRDFIFDRSVKNQIHRYMVLDLYVSVVYEYGASEGVEGILHVEFDGNQKQYEEYAIKGESINGYFSFDIEQHKTGGKDRTPSLKKKRAKACSIYEKRLGSEKRKNIRKDFHR